MRTTLQISFSRSFANAAMLLFTIIFLGSCAPRETEEKVYVALSKGGPGSSYENYVHWLRKADTSVIYVDMYNIPMDSAIGWLHKCSGLLLTGGPDIHPGRYNMEEDTAVAEDIDLRRDTLEYELMRNAQDMKLPVLGICRGAQLINVFFGGTLVADIPSQTESGVEHRCAEPSECFHEIKVMEGSSLHTIILEGRGTVNSNHHQAVRDIAPNLLVTARTEDGLPEAIEWDDPLGKPFLLGVQWHPEKLDFGSSFSGPIARAFIEEVHKYHSLIKGEINYERR